MVLDSNDAEDFQKKHKEYLEKLKDVDTQDYSTKKQLVIRLIEVTRPLIANGYVEGLKSEDLASYISNRLEEYNIEYPRNGNSFYNLFAYLLMYSSI